MNNIKVFNEISEEELSKMFTCFNTSILAYKKDAMILSNVANTTMVGVIISGTAQIVRYNYNGTKTILEQLTPGDIFGSFNASTNDDIYVVSTSLSEVVLFSYDHLINRCHNNCPYHNKLIDNIFHVFTSKIIATNERIEIISKKTIREKLLAYFNSLAKKQISKDIILPFTLTDLADYLSIDRSAMMREMKNMKEEGLIRSKGKKIYLDY